MENHKLHRIYLYQNGHLDVKKNIRCYESAHLSGNIRQKYREKWRNRPIPTVISARSIRPPSGLQATPARGTISPVSRYQPVKWATSCSMCLTKTRPSPSRYKTIGMRLETPNSGQERTIFTLYHLSVKNDKKRR